MKMHALIAFVTGLSLVSTGCSNPFEAISSGQSRASSSGGEKTIFLKAVSSSSYQNFAMAPQSSSFSLDFDAIPSANSINAATSIGQGTLSVSAPGAIGVRFNPGGMIDALKSGSYTADTNVPYSGGSAYHFHIDADFSAKTYNVLVTADGGIAQILAEKYPFNGSVSVFNDFALQASTGSHQVFNARVSTPIATNPGSAPAPGPTPMPTATPVVDASAFTATGPAAGASVSGIVTVTGQAGSNWINVAAFDLNKNYTKVSDDAAPVNGKYTLHIDTSKLAAGTANIAVIAFSTPPGVSGGNTTSVNLTFNVASGANTTPTPAPTPAPTPTPTATPSGGGTSSAGIIWQDEFDSFSLYNSVSNIGNWQGTSINGTDGGVGWGAEYDISPKDTSLGVNPYKVSGGYLTIRTDRAPSALQSKISGYKYTSGALRTVNPSFGYGYYEMRAQLPKGNGMWPAFWLLPADGAWPPEIDIVEGLGNSPTIDYTTVHSTQNFANAVNYGHWQSGNGADVGVDTTAGFHTYGCDFRADYITWYFDGKQVFKSPTPSDLVNRKMYIVLDTALGGWNGNAVDASTPFPADYVIDYVRVYSKIP